MWLPRIKRKVFLTWLVSYIFIMTCSLLAGILIYSSAVAVLRTEIKNVSGVSLENIKTQLDGKLRELGTASSILEIDNNIRTSVQSQFPFSSADTILAYRRCKDLFSRTMAYNSYISDIFLYSSKSRIILSSQYGLSEEKTAVFPAEEAFGISVDELHSLMTTKPYFKYVILPPLPDENFEQMLFFYPIMQSNFGNQGIIIFKVNTEKLLNIVLNSEKMKNTGIVIIDENNHRISTIKNGFSTDFLTYANLTGQPFQWKDSDTNLMVYSTQSNVNTWKYVFLYGMNEYLSSIYHVRDLTIVFLIGFGLVGIFISYFLAKRNYSPIERIVQSINRFSSGAGPQETNELKLLEKNLNSLFLEKESFSTRLKRQKDVILSSTFIQLLKGRTTSIIKTQDILSAEGITFKTDQFIVVLMVIEDYGKLLPNDQEDPDINKTADLAYVVVRNILEELLGDEHRGFVVEIDTLLACVINVSGQEDKDDASVMATMERALELMRTHFGLIIYSAVSNIQASLSGITEGYMEAQEALQKSLLFRKDSYVYRYSQEFKEKRNKQDGYFRLEKRNIFINQLMLENYTSSEQIAMEFLDLDQGSDADHKEMKIRKFSMIADLSSTLEMLKTDSKKNQWQEANDIILEMYNCKSITEFRLLVKRLFAKFRQVHKEKEDYLKENDKVHEIVQYIDMNLTDPNLSVSMISEAIGVSVSHLTRLLRTKMGSGALEYIQKRRIDIAKKLLRETDESVNDIASKVGYYNFRTMNYVFKRLEGITGTQYREQIRKNE